MHNIGLNGFGRIGRNFLQFYLNDNNENFELTTVNDICSKDTLAHLFKISYPSINVEITKNGIKFNNKEIKFTNKPLNKLDWENEKIVIEATGKFFSRKELQEHINKKANYAVLSSPSEETDITLMAGINDNEFNEKKHKLISASSCTAQAVLPIIKALENFKIAKLYFTTIHPYTVNNHLLDTPGRNLREARSVTQSIIPAQTKADIGFSSIIKSIETKAYAYKIPTNKIACLYLTFKTINNISIKEITNKLENFSRDNPNLLKINKEPLVSKDFENCNASTIVDIDSINVIDNLVSIFSWYDNEWAYSMRLYELIKILVEKL